jgi:hypothetical protein
MSESHIQLPGLGLISIMEMISGMLHSYQSAEKCRGACWLIISSIWSASDGAKHIYSKSREAEQYLLQKVS